ncbi:hypothetical protein OIDMADRAFT_35952 [Oidiodendron maius Zn]|uniref:MADS-box domain-containing protein n=1 Tax=Oidiodendron maius (strain Zn) TaxID=913774 RepID=A0A0C3GS56_OIDMZ|nr:hypothetical protein OIDMADRAFT_35952 [Oidiodendron maius Zn]
MAITLKSTLKSSRANTKRQKQNPARRIETLFVRSHEIWESYGVDVAVIVMKGGRYSTYSTRPHRPPSMADIGATYPLPKNLLPKDLEGRIAKRMARTQRRRGGEASTGLHRVPESRKRGQLVI